MENYKFIKDYKDNDKLRLSFDALAKETFGISFETWYQNGYWNENYICYSYFDGDDIVSNVSMNTMELLVAGEKKRAIQIGTVMTKESYRRKGFALDLMHKVFEDYDDHYDFYFLAADDDAIVLYEKCGFRARSENKFKIDLSGYELSRTKVLEPVEIDGDVLLRYKRAAQPLSQAIWGLDTDHVFMFYYTLGFSQIVYKVEDAYAIFEIKEDVMHLYDIIAYQEIDIETFIRRAAPKGTTQVICHFTPEGDIKGLSHEKDENSSWMIRSSVGDIFPPDSRFPMITQT